MKTTKIKHTNPAIYESLKVLTPRFQRFINLINNRMNNLTESQKEIVMLILKLEVSKRRIIQLSKKNQFSKANIQSIRETNEIERIINLIENNK